MELQIFTNEAFGEVRTVVIEEEPWFVGKDVAEILGYANTRDAMTKHVDAEDKGVAKCDTLGGEQELTVINESGLYSLILTSRMPEAKAFKRWVTSEVLPSIRKHGIYGVDDIIADPDRAIEILKAIKAERQEKERLKKELEVKDQQLIEMQPKASYYDVVLNCKDLLSITEIAKDYGWSGKKLNQFLQDKKVQFKQGKKVWILYQKFAEKGYTSTKTSTYPGNDGEIHTAVHTYWTQKGRLFLYDLLKDNGVLPLIEQE